MLTRAFLISLDTVWTVTSIQEEKTESIIILHTSNYLEHQNIHVMLSYAKITIKKKIKKRKKSGNKNVESTSF